MSKILTMKNGEPVMVEIGGQPDMVVYTIVGMSDGEPVVIHIDANLCPFNTAMDVHDGYIIKDDTVIATIDSKGNIQEW